MSDKRIPELSEMGGHKAWMWEAWKLYKKVCLNRANIEYDFEKLSKEAQLEEYMKFEEFYEKDKKDE